MPPPSLSTVGHQFKNASPLAFLSIHVFHELLLSILSSIILQPAKPTNEPSNFYMHTFRRNLIRNNSLSLGSLQLQLVSTIPYIQPYTTLVDALMGGWENALGINFDMKIDGGTQKKEDDSIEKENNEIGTVSTSLQIPTTEQVQAISKGGCLSLFGSQFLKGSSNSDECNGECITSGESNKTGIENYEEGKENMEEKERQEENVVDNNSEVDVLLVKGNVFHYIKKWRLKKTNKEESKYYFKMEENGISFLIRRLFVWSKQRKKMEEKKRELEEKRKKLDQEKKEKKDIEALIGKKKVVVKKIVGLGSHQKTQLSKTEKTNIVTVGSKTTAAISLNRSSPEPVVAVSSLLGNKPHRKGKSSYNSRSGSPYSCYTYPSSESTFSSSSDDPTYSFPNSPISSHDIENPPTNPVFENVQQKSLSTSINDNQTDSLLSAGQDSVAETVSPYSFQNRTNIYQINMQLCEQDATSKEDSPDVTNASDGPSSSSSSFSSSSSETTSFTETRIVKQNKIEVESTFLLPQPSLPYLLYYISPNRSMNSLQILTPQANIFDDTDSSNTHAPNMTPSLMTTPLTTPNPLSSPYFRPSSIMSSTFSYGSGYQSSSSNMIINLGKTGANMNAEVGGESMGVPAYRKQKKNEQCDLIYMCYIINCN
jgi:hypothetical protein